MSKIALSHYQLFSASSKVAYRKLARLAVIDLFQEIYLGSIFRGYALKRARST